jgi:hypothetical protein
MKTLSIILGTLSFPSIIAFLAIVLFIYFMFKIYKNKGVSLRYSLIMALLGIIIVILSMAINTGYSEGGKSFKNALLIFGIIFTAYGGFVSINKYLKDKEKTE